MARSCLALLSVLIMLAVTANAAAPMQEPQDAESEAADVRWTEAHTDAAEAGVKLVFAPTEKKDRVNTAALPQERGIVIAGRQDDEGSSGGSDHDKEGKEGGKQAKSCVSKEECHKKRLVCAKGCTLSVHSKCAAKCSKACLPTC